MIQYTRRQAFGAFAEARRQVFELSISRMEVMPMCYTLNEIKEKTVPIAQSYGIQSLGVFGSYARNEATDESDIDICVEKVSLRSLLQYFAFVQELEKNLGCHVDVITTEIEDTEFLNRVLAERVLLYER
jgi:hypothetical protein